MTTDQCCKARIENTNLSGIYNAVAPVPVSNRDLIIELARARKKFYIPFYVPSIILKIVFGELSIEVLKSATVSSAKIGATGFVFQYPTLQRTIQKLVGS